MWFSKELKLGLQMFLFIHFFLYTFRLQYQSEIDYIISPIYHKVADSLCPQRSKESITRVCSAVFRSCNHLEYLSPI